MTPEEEITLLQDELEKALYNLGRIKILKDEYKKVLERIASLDYRPLKSPESLMAKMALEQREF